MGPVWQRDAGRASQELEDAPVLHEPALPRDPQEPQHIIHQTRLAPAEDPDPDLGQGDGGRHVGQEEDGAVSTHTAHLAEEEDGHNEGQDDLEGDRAKGQPEGISQGLPKLGASKALVQHGSLVVLEADELRFGRPGDAPFVQAYIEGIDDGDKGEDAHDGH